MIKSVYAAIDISKEDVNPIARFSDFGILLNKIIPTIMIIASLVFLLILLFGAYTYVTSGGEQEKIQKSRKTITYSVLGLILIFLSYLIISIVSIITGIELLF